MYKGYGYENPFQIKVTCPYCNKPTKKEQLSCTSTLVYQPLMYDENGNLIPPENSSNTSRYTWRCLECGNTFVTDGKGNILSKDSSSINENLIPQSDYSNSTFVSEDPSVKVSFGLQTNNQPLYLTIDTSNNLNIKG